MVEWPNRTLGDLVTLQRGIDLPTSKRSEGEVPVMGSFGITGYHNEAAMPGPGVTVGRSGASIGVVSYIDRDYWPLNTCLYVKDFHGNNLRFAYYLLSSLDLSNYNSGSAQPSLNRNYIHPIPLAFPARNEQDLVAELLGSLDDKIELNRRMNATLEAMVRAIFKDWFVDFGPTRAKAEGRAPYIASELWDLFPDALDDEDKPVGWQDDMLGSFTNLQNGYAFKSKDWRDSGVPVVKIGSVKPAFVDLDQVSFVDEALALKKTNFRLSTGDMLVGLTGYVGETGRIPPTQYTPMLNQRVGRFLPNPGLEPFVFSSVRRPEFKEFAESKSHGSAQANVSTKDLLTYPLPNPGELIIKTFCDIASPLFKSSLANSGQTSSLAQTRDLLLPKLMSGEIRLREAERVVEAVA